MSFAAVAACSPAALVRAPIAHLRLARPRPSPLAPPAPAPARARLHTGLPLRSYVPPAPRSPRLSLPTSPALRPFPSATPAPAPAPTAAPGPPPSLVSSPPWATAAAPAPCVPAALHPSLSGARALAGHRSCSAPPRAAVPRPDPAADSGHPRVPAPTGSQAARTGTNAPALPHRILHGQPLSNWGGRDVRRQFARASHHGHRGPTRSRSHRPAREPHPHRRHRPRL